MKLPGSLIYMDEALDEAAQRVLYELTGLKNVKIRTKKGEQIMCQNCSKELAKTYDPKSIEDRLYKKWEDTVSYTHLDVYKRQVE